MLTLGIEFPGLCFFNRKLETTRSGGQFHEIFDSLLVKEVTESPERGSSSLSWRARETKSFSKKKSIGPRILREKPFKTESHG